MARLVGPVHAQVFPADFLREQNPVADVFGGRDAEEFEGLKVLRGAKAQLAPIVHIEGEHDVVQVAEPGDPGVVDVVDALPHLFDPLEMDDLLRHREAHAVRAPRHHQHGLTGTALHAQHQNVRRR